MYILEREDNIIMHISETLARQEITNYYLINYGNIAVPTQFVQNIFEVAEVPDYVEPEKYCYNETKGFFFNEHYREPEE